MTAEADSAFANLLARAAKGEATFPEMAAALAQHDGMILVASPAEMHRFYQDMNDAVKVKGVGNVKVDDAPMPKPLGMTTAEGFVANVFTDGEVAREFMVAKGLLDPDETFSFISKGWHGALHEALLSGWAGLIVDEGSDHKMNLPRTVVARLFAEMDLEHFASLPALYTVTINDQVFVQRPDADTAQAFVFDSDRAWEAARTVLPPHPGLGSRATGTLKLLRELVDAGVTDVIVNHTLPDERAYARAEVERMLQGRGPAPVARPARPLIARPGRSDDEARRVFKTYDARVKQRDGEVWQVAEGVGFDLDLYVPRHPKSVDGLSWPQFFKHPLDEKKTIAFTASSERGVRRMLQDMPPDSRGYVALSGVEALRWIWSAPTSIDDVAIDYGDQEAWITFPSWWVLALLFPLHHALPDLRRVPAVGLAQLPKLPGARGLKPEVVRALVLGWKILVGANPTGDEPCVVDHDGGRYVPVFSSLDRFRAYAASTPGFTAKMETAGADAPFGRLFDAAQACDGAVLDPGAQPALRLDHTDLLVLDLWTSSGGAQPTASQIVTTLGLLRQQDWISAAMAGRIAADIPRYFVGALVMAGDKIAIIHLPKSDTGVLFTTEEKARAYFLAHQGLLVEGEPRAVKFFSTWKRSALKIVADTFTEAWIDPEPGGEGGLHLTRAALDAARERLDEKLRPRVPAFVVA